MKTDEIRQKYLDFFQHKDHRLCPSDVLVPTWDNSVLFTPAGMNQFKDHFLGKVELDFKRATSCQKCLRTGDIDNVGRTAYHHTFFEMLGNFSFGDYFKRDAINWAWEFLTDKKWLGIHPDQLTATVYLDDDEAAGIWESDIGLSKDRVRRLDEHENFWPAGAPTDGPDGVCGPCSEIFFHPPDGSEEVEIWNLVFTQFNRVGDPPNNLEPLPSKNIDTGMGLERIAATMQGVTTNYHIDILRPIVEAAGEVCGIKYEPNSENGRRLRRITDHVRACTFAIHENVTPGPQKENYVIRRLLRRGVLDGHQMGQQNPFLYQLVPAVVQAMSQSYPELDETKERVAHEIRAEEENFLGTLDGGLNRIDRIFGSMESGGSTVVDGNDAAVLYQTYGFPAELFEQIAKNRQFGFDWDSYHRKMEEHARKSGTLSDTVMGDVGPIDDIKRETKSTEFLGYENTESTATVVGLVEKTTQNETVNETRQNSIAEPDTSGGIKVTQMVVLDRTPFYAESGGQVGDTGIIEGQGGRFEVTDCQKNGDVFVHVGQIVQGKISQGDELRALVDVDRRDAIRRAHSATHILHYALHQNLGSHANQKGSKVADDWLRFDFSNREAVEFDQLAKIEANTRDRVASNEPIIATILPLADAKEQGATMLFGEKYPDPVRMVSMGEFSKELCGGIHLSNTGEVQTFEIIKEDNVAAGTRRIEALTGEKADKYQKKVRESASRTMEILNVDQPQSIPGRVRELAKQVKELKKQVSSGTKAESNETKVASVSEGEKAGYLEIRESLRGSARELNCQLFDVPERVAAMQQDVEKLAAHVDQSSGAGTLDVDSIIESAPIVSGARIIVHEVPGGNPNIMRQLIDRIRKKASPVAIFFATVTGEEKVLLIAGVSRDLVDKGVSAGDWVKHVAPTVGGGGGGKADLAQAGGKQPENIKQALDSAIEYMNGVVVS